MPKMTKTTKLNILILIINLAMICIHFNERRNLDEEDANSVLVWKNTLILISQTMASNWPRLSPDIYDVALEEGMQYDDPKNIKQYWADKRAEWTELNTALEKAANKEINIGLSAEECISKYGEPKYITALDYCNLYEFHTKKGMVIKIFIDTQMKKSFGILYMDFNKLSETLVPIGEKYGHFHYKKGELHFLNVWVSAELGPIIFNKMN